MKKQIAALSVAGLLVLTSCGAAQPAANGNANATNLNANSAAMNMNANSMMMNMNSNAGMMMNGNMNMDAMMNSNGARMMTGSTLPSGSSSFNY